MFGRRYSDRAPATQAIVDIGSNSLRLVLYGPKARVPSVLYNEKVAAGLGRGLAESGAISDAAFASGVAACARFAAVLRAAEVEDVLTVATAAPRDAANGAAFLKEVRRAGLDPVLLSGEDEAMGSAMGILSAFPDAQGVVGDIGGGSLELIEIADGRTVRPASFPLGTLRLPPFRLLDGALDARRIGALLQDGGWGSLDEGATYYSVGGTGRALAALDLHLLGVSSPIVHGHVIRPDRLPLLQRAAQREPAELKRIPGVATARIPMLGDFAGLLVILAQQLGLQRFVFSAYGLREGLLYQRLSPAERALDPLVEAARDYQVRHGRPGWDGAVVAPWIAPLFSNDKTSVRLRFAASLLSGAGLQEGSEARAEHAFDVALLGPWVGIDYEGRQSLAQALYRAWGGKGTPGALASADPAKLAQATIWGEAIRFAERLGANHSDVLTRARLERQGSAVILTLPRRDEALYGEVVRKQHRSLASALGGEALLALA